MSWADRFKEGSIVRLNPKYAKGSWREFTTGVIVGPTSDEGFGSAAGNRNHNWKVRWDAHDYGHRTHDCHTVNDAVIAPDEPDESELAAAMASIQDAARKTTSKESLHE